MTAACAACDVGKTRADYAERLIRVFMPSGGAFGRIADGAVKARMDLAIFGCADCRVKERFPDAIEWPAVGLPEDCLALLAPGRTAFVREGERIVGHGGVPLEEVVVPMVEIERVAA